MDTVVFDFDRTLTRDDTVRGYYRELSRSWPDFQRRIAPMRAASLAGRLRLLSQNTIKRLGFTSFLSGRTEGELEDVGARYVRTLDLHGAVVEQLDRHLRIGSRVFVVSASWEVYVRAFRPEATTIGTGIEYVNGVARRMGLHCAGTTKVEMLRALHGIEQVDEAYSDSWGDLPLLRMARRPFFVGRAGAFRQLRPAELAR